MPRSSDAQKRRCIKMLEYIQEKPLSTDKELSEYFHVSINTIRLDRARLNIKESRERTKQKAIENLRKVVSLTDGEFVGTMVEFNANKSAVATYNTKEYMTFNNSNVVKGSYIYSFAESIAISLIPTKVALVGVANIKYFEKVYANQTIKALAEVKRKTNTGYVVWVRIFDMIDNLKFKGKYILKGIE